MIRQEILSLVREKKPCSIAQLDRYLVRFKIKPIGIRQRPQQYPPDSAERILTSLGLVASSPTADKTTVQHHPKLVTPAQLRAVKPFKKR